MFNPVSTMETRIVSTNWQVNIFSSFFPFLFLFCPPFFHSIFRPKIFKTKEKQKSRYINYFFSKKIPLPSNFPQFSFSILLHVSTTFEETSQLATMFLFSPWPFNPFRELIHYQHPLCNFHGIIRLYSPVYLPPLLPISKNFPSLAGRKVSSPRERPVFTFTS